MVYALLLSVAVGFCSGQRIDGTSYREFIESAQAGYKNQPAWSINVQRAQQAAKTAGHCSEVRF